MAHSPDPDLPGQILPHSPHRPHPRSALQVREGSPQEAHRQHEPFEVSRQAQVGHRRRTLKGHRLPQSEAL